MYIQDWIAKKLKAIAEVLYMQVMEDASSFKCGFNTGYKQAMIDLDNLIEEGAEIYRSRCKCGDKYHGVGEICL